MTNTNYVKKFAKILQKNDITKLLTKIMPKVMILDFSFKLGDHEVMVHVSELTNVERKYWVSVREFDLVGSLVEDIDCTFKSKISALNFAKEYVKKYLE